MRVRLTVSRGKNAGKAFDVNVPQFVIGRAKGCQLRPQSDAISRQHCVISVNEENATIRDLGSRNGTIVNGEKVQGTYTLADGDDLRVGPLFLTVELETKSAKPSPANTETLAASSDETIATVPTKTDAAPEPTPTVVMPAAKTSDSDDNMDIGAWLEEDDRTDDTKIRKAETLRFRLDESERIEIKKAAEETEAEKVVAAKDGKKKKKKKKELGKLPERKQEVTDNSRDAAEATLRKMFNRGL